MGFIPIHVAFDLLAALCSLAVTWMMYQWRLTDRVRLIERAGIGYVVALLGGAAIGGYLLGTVNLVLSGRPGIGRSIIGALLGAILAIEAFKVVRGIRGSTGIIFVPAFCTTVVVGRIGCLLSGMDDFTYGTPTSSLWGHDFGDGVLRHPVQLYEALAMGGFLVATVAALRARTAFFLRNGFYLMTAWYAIQRHVWEFLKPYGALVADQNVFQLAALVLLIYAAVMIGRVEHGHSQRFT